MGCAEIKDMISRHFKIAGIGLSLVFTVSVASAQSNVALVIGNSAYQNVKPLSTTIADASAVAEIMRGASYDVIISMDVRQRDIGDVMRTFLDKVAAGGGHTVAFFYYAGYAAQANSENYLVPVDTSISSASDVALQSLRLNELIEALSKIPAAARIIMLDASYDHGFGRGTAQTVPPGLAAMEAPPGMMITSAAAPGQVAVGRTDANSVFTRTLISVMRQPGLELDRIVKATRYQVNQATAGRQTPWTASALMVDVTLFSALQPKKAEEPRTKKRQAAERPRKRTGRSAPSEAKSEPAQSSPPIIFGIGGGGIGIGIGR
jgi:uncharacterized caspase-like protein